MRLAAASVTGGPLNMELTTRLDNVQNNGTHVGKAQGVRIIQSTWNTHVKIQGTGFKATLGDSI